MGWTEENVLILEKKKKKKAIMQLGENPGFKEEGRRVIHRCFLLSMYDYIYRSSMCDPHQC